MYEKPEMDLIMIPVVDIVRTSDFGREDFGDGEEVPW